MKVEELLHPSKSFLSLKLSDGNFKRMRFSMHINDYLVTSILKSFRRILNKELFENLV